MPDDLTIPPGLTYDELARSGDMTYDEVADGVTWDNLVKQDDSDSRFPSLPESDHQ